MMAFGLAPKDHHLKPVKDGAKINSIDSTYQLIHESIDSDVARPTVLNYVKMTYPTSANSPFTHFLIIMEIEEETMEVAQEPAAAEAIARQDADEYHTNTTCGEGYMSKRWMICIFRHQVPNGWDPSFFIAANTDIIDYAVWQEERCPKTGSYHWHIYLRLKLRRRMISVKNLCPKNQAGVITANFKKCLGNEEQCRNYCTKPDDRVQEGTEYGTYKPEEGKQGQRSDLIAIRDEIKKGTGMATIAEKYTGDFLRYHNGIQKLLELLGPQPAVSRDVEVIVLWGPTGTGKTHRVLTNYPDNYQVNPGRDPWGGYRGQETILFDEFKPEAWEVTKMNQYLDKWRLNLDCRYNNKQATWKRVFICSNDPPRNWYRSGPAMGPSGPITIGPMLEEAFLRRITDRCWLVQSREPTLQEILASAPSTPTSLPPQ